MNVPACMNGVPTGFPSVSGKAPSVTRMSPPGKVRDAGIGPRNMECRVVSERRVAALGRDARWHFGAGFVEARQRGFRQADGVGEERVVESIGAVAIEPPDAVLPG